MDRHVPVRYGETPTWLVIAAVYCGWIALTWFHDSLPWLGVLGAGAWLVAWHGSLQHEILHGHPTRRQWLNDLFAMPPLGLWIPYPIYRETHRIHHATGALTDPAEDPESFYVPAKRWAELGVLGRYLLLANNTLAGRLVLGPWLAAVALWCSELPLLRSGRRGRRRVWAIHVVLAALVLAWTGLCGMGPLDYILLFAWPGLSLTLLRSFAEHRPAGPSTHRTAIVEAGPLLGLLFLNNNLHVVHHARPGLPWHALPAAYRDEHAAFARSNGGYLYSGGYLEIARRYLFRPKDHPAYPAPVQ